MAKFVQPHGEQFHVRSSGGGWFGPEAHVPEVAPDYAPYTKGDRLYVREAWASLAACTHNDPGSQALADNGFYRADGGTIDGEIDRWRPSIHMPRWASRLTLIVEEVRVERLQVISEDDAAAEGAKREPIGVLPGSPAHFQWDHGQDTSPDYAGFISAKASFRHLWRSLNGDDSWAANPFVVALTFRVVHGNIDRIEA